MKPQFTRHALQRAGERLSLTIEEVAEIIEHDRCILLGKDSRSNRVHKLFFSEPDSYWFVAVQDEKSGEVVTILPIDYHNRWNVSAHALTQAQELVQKKAVEPEPSPVAKQISESSPRAIKFGAIVETKRGKKRHINLGSFSSLNYKSAAAVLLDKKAVTVLHEKLSSAKGEEEVLIVCTARFGGRGVPIKIVLPVLTEM